MHILDLTPRALTGAVTSQTLHSSQWREERNYRPILSLLQISHAVTLPRLSNSSVSTKYTHLYMWHTYYDIPVIKYITVSEEFSNNKLFLIGSYFFPLCKMFWHFRALFSTFENILFGERSLMKVHYPICAYGPYCSLNLITNGVYNLVEVSFYISTTW